MDEDELTALLDELEAALAADVDAQLSLVAAEFADAVQDSTALVAARFSVSSIRDMWKRRVPRVMERLRRITRRASDAAAREVGGDRLTQTELNRQLRDYTTATQALLDAVGDRLAADATQALAEGLNAGDSPARLKARLTELFKATGPELGPTRAQRIAATETTRAWNAATLATASALQGPERPLVKQWLTRNDDRVRAAHRDANGQLQLLDDPFDVGGTPMQYPGDPAAPADLTVNCRCVMRAQAARRPEDDVTADASGNHLSGAMIALIPADQDASRLALAGGESRGQLHLTLYFLGDGADWDDAARSRLVDLVQAAARWLGPVRARAFGAAQWNPAGDSPCWVYNVGDLPGTDTRLLDVRESMGRALDARVIGPDVPDQFTPWAPHVCAVYTSDNVSEELAAGCGDVTFDRIRLAFAGEQHDFTLEGDLMEDEATEVAEEVTVPQTLGWSTPGGTALAFENQQTGDSRLFAPDALYWKGGPWPLQYADEMNGGHEGAQLAGAITDIGRDGGRITGEGVLYLTQPAGVEAAMLLSQGAPLGVSVDLDDVDVEFLDATGNDAEAGDKPVALPYTAHLVTASLLPLDDGSWVLRGRTATEWTASGTSLAGEASYVEYHVDVDGLVPGSALEVTAAAGDADPGTSVVVDRQRSGDYLMRITKARVRGATLVSIPAYADARIVLDNVSMFAAAGDLTAAAGDYDAVVSHIRSSDVPVTAAETAHALKMSIVTARRHLSAAAQKGYIVRIARGMYVRTKGEPVEDLHYVRTASAGLTASATGAVDLPVADRDADWDGDAAMDRVFNWADGDCDKIGRAFAYRDDDMDCALKGAWKLGYADVLDGTLTIIPRGVFAAQAAVEGARGGADLKGDTQAVRNKLAAVRAHVDEATGGDGQNQMEASAWTAMQSLPPMPAAWFAEPTLDELPPGGAGVNYDSGRIFGWVAQAGEPHAGFAKKITIDGLGRIDTSHFLRQRFQLDDGSSVKAGAFTMNAGHHRDGAECETAACQFDDTRFVAGIVTVGMNERGMWFSGAAAPWLSEWDRSVFMSCQPSYHLRKGGNGSWQLRAVLSVPVPGHSSPLLASAVAERAQMALTAAATMAEVEEAVAAENERQTATEDVTAGAGPAGPGNASTSVLGNASTEVLDYDRLADAMVAAMARAEQRKADEAAELAALLEEARSITASAYDGDDAETDEMV